MKAYGYEIKGDALLKLEEVSFVLSIGEIGDLMAFLEDVREQMKERGDSFGHEHFKDWLAKNSRVGTTIDIVVTGGKGSVTYPPESVKG